MTALALCTLLSGCEKEEAVDANARRVEVVFSPGGVGDQGYNDNILAGLQQASVKYGFTLAIHIPKEKRQAEDIYEAWRNSQPGEGCERSLFVFSGSEYEYLLDSLPLPQDERKDVLMFETDKQVEGVYTFCVGSYGASYLAGATSVMDTQGMEQKALVIAANPHDRNVRRAVEGYRDGYLAAGGNGCDVHYLSADPDGGYDQQDSAYKVCMKTAGLYDFRFAVAGSSNMGMYRFSRENLELVVGMYCDMSAQASMMLFSVGKHMDRAVGQVVGDLLKNRNIPYHQKFMYSSGYEELVFAPHASADWFLDISDIRNRITAIEQAYEEAAE